MKLTMEQCAFYVGGLLLEQAPKAILMSDTMLVNYYEPALQNFKDLLAHEYQVTFEPDSPEQFKSLTMDFVHRHLDTRRRRLGL